MGYVCLICRHTYAKNKCSFMKLPADLQTLKQWKKVLKLSTEGIAKKSARVCCCHFPNYNKKNLPINRDSYSTLRKRHVLVKKPSTSEVTVSVDDVHTVDSSNDVLTIDDVIQTDCSLQLDAGVQVDSILQTNSAVQTDCILKNDSKIQTEIGIADVSVQTAESIEFHEAPYNVLCEENKLQKKRILQHQNHILSLNGRNGHFEFTILSGIIKPAKLFVTQQNMNSCLTITNQSQPTDVTDSTYLFPF